MDNKRFLTANDVAEYMGISVPMAYKIIRRLNDELVAAGYIIVSGRISRSYDYKALFQYFDVRKTLRTKQGVCFDFSHLFTALCRSQNIPCYAVDGISYKDSTVSHTWNRVYYDGSWWNMDVTNDISSTATGKSLYGFRKLDAASAPDEDFFITKIY